MKFKVKDVVKTKDGEIGIVGWTENECMNLSEKDGFLGIDLITGSRGFAAPVKADACTKGSLDEAIDWWENKCNEIEGKYADYCTLNDKLESSIKENKILKKLLKIYLQEE